MKQHAKCYNKGCVRCLGKRRNAWRCFESWEKRGILPWARTQGSVSMPGTKDLRLRKERHESGLKLELELGFK